MLKQRRFNVDWTSRRWINVESALFQRCVSTVFLLYMYAIFQKRQNEPDSSGLPVKHTCDISIETQKWFDILEVLYKIK